jgi:DNA-binding transcriptional regulator WhiA
VLHRHVHVLKINDGFGKMVFYCERIFKGGGERAKIARLLKTYKQHIEKYWESDTFAEKEEFFEEFTRNVHLSCGLISDLIASDQWKKTIAI